MYTSGPSSPRAASPAAVAIGLPARVPAWNTVPRGVSVSITSRRPPIAPIGRPPPITLPNAVRSGVTSYLAWAPPVSRRNPVITSSKISRAPTRSHSARRPSRNPGCGATTPMLAATGSTMTAATESSSSRHLVVRHDERLGHRAGRHPGCSGDSQRGDAAAAGGEQRIGGAVEVAVERHDAIATSEPAGEPDGGARGFSPGVHQPRLLAAGDPCRDLLGELHLPWCRSAVRRAVGGGSPDRRGDRRMGVTEDHGAVALHEVDVATTLDVEHVRPLGTGDDVRLATDRLEGADRRVDATGDRRRRPGEQRVVGRNPAAGADDRVASGGRTGARVAVRNARHSSPTGQGPRRTTSRST